MNVNSIHPILPPWASEVPSPSHYPDMVAIAHPDALTGLLPLLKSIQKPTELKKFAGKTLAVDAYVWLHRGAIACAVALAQGKPTRKYNPQTPQAKSPQPSLAAFPSPSSYPTTN